MYKCARCGSGFEEPHNRYNLKWRESDDSWQYCPICGSTSLEEAEMCEICGEVFFEDELKCGVCEKCRERDDPREAYAYGEDRRGCVLINGFLVYAYSAREIEGLLWQDLMRSSPSIVKDYANKFITEDIGDFAEWYKEERKDD